MNESIKRVLKQKVAFLMALSMISNASGIVSAAESISGTDSTAASENSSPSTSDAIGRIDIELGSALLIDNIDGTVTLTGNGRSESKNVSIKKSEGQKISFGRLADGEYTIEISAKGFATYRQSVDVKGKLYTLEITAGECNGANYTEGATHAGFIMIGDVNGDGVVNEDDKNIMLDALEEKSIPQNCTTDLNRDGETNLLDLMFFAKGYNSDKDNISAVTEMVSPDAVTAKVSEDTKVTGGSVKEMLSGEGTVTLAPKNEGEISRENPVSVEFDMEASGTESVSDGITFGTGETTHINEALIDVSYTDEDGEHTVEVPVTKDVSYLLKESEVRAEIDRNGNIQVHFGKQVAVKRVVLTITALQAEEGSNNLAEISKVEFVNGMENRIPEPVMDIPEEFVASASSQKITLTWKPCNNVTSYEVKVESPKGTTILPATSNSMTITTIGKEEVKNYTTYKISVQSVNGTWKSGYCDAQEVTPKPSKRPDKPDNVKATGAFRSVKVGWKKMDDTQYYHVFYKLMGSSDKFTEINVGSETSYNIDGLDNLKEYEVYVKGYNELGASPESLHTSATTTDLNLADMPQYNLINRDEKGNPGSTHITDVRRYGGEMIDSEPDKDKNNTAWGAVDGNKASYYKIKANYDGGWNWLGSNGLTYTFDQAYTMDTIGLLTVNTDIEFSHVKWWDENNVVHEDWNGSWDYTNLAVGQNDAQGRRYYFIKLPKPITAKKIQIGTGRRSSPNTVAEVYFYKYDTLMDEVMNLYVDDLHTVLKDEVTQKTIDDLREKIKTPDEFGNENFNKAALLRELETAEKILKAKSISQAVTIHNGITTVDTGRGFGGLNAWQPLGVSVGTNEEVTIYVGSNKKKTGENTNLRLIATQYHSESSGVTLDGANLKVGANTFRLTRGSMVGQESGGALYIQYQGNSNSDETYSVRVTGGSSVPMLDLYKVTDKAERMEKAVAYIKALDEYVPNMEALHNEVHKGSKNKKIDMAYDRQNCILGASDIQLDTMMISLPAQQILAGAGSGTVEQRAEKLLNSMTAMEDMMYLFYQHKGLNASAPSELNQIPKQHLNIRYQRMFSGAFMYASGNHIGIEWGSATGLVNGVPIESDNGRYVSGRYFGWGIAHEIGHNINQGTYSVAEITNNYFAQLAQAKDTNEGMRFQYKNIYDKVTSGTKGDCSNIATQLGMYWQLHLAYDKGLNYTTYSNYKEQLDNIFYARVDTYSRNTAAAPAPNGITLSLNGDSDQNLMRLACAAAEKNVLEFFRRWGKSPDETTIKYAEQFETEKRAIMYANDDSRIYALNGSGSVLGTESSVKAIENVSVSKGKAPNKVNLRFTSTGIPASDILGYEVIRCTISGGKVQETPVGFATGSTFTDTVTTMNNRTVFYKVTLIDQYLNRSETVTTNQVKIEHDGSMDIVNPLYKRTQK